MRKNQENTDSPKNRKLADDIDSADTERDLTVIVNRLEVPFWSDRGIKAVRIRPVKEPKNTEQQ